MNESSIRVAVFNVVKVINLKKEYRIKKNSDFQYAFKAGKSFANRQLVIYYVKKEGQSHFRMGLSVGKKIGNAVTRNRIKRYLRQAFFELKDDIAYPYDIVIIARQPAKQMTFSEIKKSLTHLLYKEHLLKNH
ncbi:ribonuclease P protein component [Virgibacillus chiguensis]|uniref:Ribonuclease P protein component n=1 Tax=Virgibacillus chiguensis TaxID=411959 RepID=A0A1M5VFC1_9BACI|nr:ribonuclease P protein component [Virgibacillus chiguensis]